MRWYVLVLDLKLYLVTTKPGFISRWRKVSRPSFDLVMRVGEGFSTTGSAVTSITGGGMFDAAGRSHVVRCARRGDVTDVSKCNGSNH